MYHFLGPTEKEPKKTEEVKAESVSARANCYEKMNILLSLCRQSDRGFCIVFCESDSSWYIEINSIAQSEGFIGKNRFSFDDAADDAIFFLRS